MQIVYFLGSSETLKVIPAVPSRKTSNMFVDWRKLMLSDKSVSTGARMTVYLQWW